MMYRKFFLIVPVAVASVACTGVAPKVEDNSYKTLIVRCEDRTLRQEYTARLEGRQVVEIRPQVSGLITRNCIGEGSRVAQGQTLFVIDLEPYVAAVAEAKAGVGSAEAKLATARLNLESTQMLREKDVVQDYDLSAARNELAAAEASLAQVRRSWPSPRTIFRIPKSKVRSTAWRA